MVNYSAWLGRASVSNIHILQEACKLKILFSDLFFFLSRHPDKNNDPAAENRFVEINQAYEVKSLLLHIKGYGRPSFR
jgi:hypothetical protein